MINETKAMRIINYYLENESNLIKEQFYPISVSSLKLNGQLCEELIDFLGDVYVVSGLDINYEDNLRGKEIQEVIHLLAFYRGNQKSDLQK